MRQLFLVLVILAAGCDPRPAPKEAARPSEPQRPGGREDAARAAVAARGDRPATAPVARAIKGNWRGLDLAAAPATADVSKLPDIFEPRPAGSLSYVLRDDVAVVPPKDIFTDGTVYWIKSRTRFYVQHDDPGSSTLHYFGPFEGDPHQVLKPPPTEATGL